MTWAFFELSALAEGERDDALLQNFVVFAPVILKYGTARKLDHDVFYTMIEKVCEVSTVDVIICCC